MSRPTIIIDTRERNGSEKKRTFFLDKITSLIDKHNLPHYVECRNLKTGDFLIHHPSKRDIIIERKTASDLRSSVRNGHIFKQMDRLTSLQEDGSDCYFLIESERVFGIGDEGNMLSEDDYMLSSGLSNQISFSSFGPILSRNAGESCLQIIRIAEKQQTGAKWFQTKSPQKAWNNLNPPGSMPEPIFVFMKSLGFTKKILENVEFRVLDLVNGGGEFVDGLNLCYKGGRSVSRKKIQQIKDNISKPLNVVLEGVYGVGKKKALDVFNEHGEGLMERGYLEELLKGKKVVGRAVSEVLLYEVKGGD